VHQFLIGGVVGQQQALGVSGSHSPHQPRSSDGSAHYGNVIGQFCFNQTVGLSSTCKKGKKKFRRTKKSTILSVSLPSAIRQ
jgi:hypothetical protein